MGAKCFRGIGPKFSRVPKEVSVLLDAQENDGPASERARICSIKKAGF